MSVLPAGCGVDAPQNRVLRGGRERPSSKIGAFYVAVLPQFIPAHDSHLAVGLLLAFVHDLEGLVWFTAIILGAHSARTLLGRRSARRVIDGATGATLVGFGLRLGLSGR